MGRKSNYENGMYNQLMDLMNRMDSFEKESNQKIRSLNHRIDELENENAILKTENAVLKAENKLLKEDNARLKSIINNDSSNTSLPPSTDQKGGKPANTYNGREKSNRKSGGQKGRKGTTLTKADVEEKIKNGIYRFEIRNLGKVKGNHYVTKYILDLEVNPKVIELRIYPDENGKLAIPSEYRSDVTYGANVRALAVSLYSEGVMSNDRIAAFLNAASENTLELSEGSVYSFCRKLAENAQPSISHLETTLLNQKVVATDATGITVNGKLNYIRNFSIQNTVVYRAMKSKAIEALEKIDFLKKYSGTLVHDHETALYHFGTEHAECNVHLLRYLRKNTEETENQWSKKMSDLMKEINQKRKELLIQEERRFSKKELQQYETRYNELIILGREENKKTSHEYAKSDEKTLLNRLENYKSNHLLFMYDFSVPFDNNMSERDLRKVKNRQKMSGGFRKESGNEMYCSILTIVETLKRRNLGLIENLKKLFVGTPAIF